MELDVPRIFLKRGIELKGMEIDRFVFSDRKEGKSDISFELISHCSQGNIDPLLWKWRDRVFRRRGSDRFPSVFLSTCYNCLCCRVAFVFCSRVYTRVCRCVCVSRENACNFPTGFRMLLDTYCNASITWTTTCVATKSVVSVFGLLELTMSYSEGESKMFIHSLLSINRKEQTN